MKQIFAVVAQIFALLLFVFIVCPLPAFADTGYSNRSQTEAQNTESYSELREVPLEELRRIQVEPDGSIGLVALNQQELSDMKEYQKVVRQLKDLQASNALDTFNPDALDVSNPLIAGLKDKLVKTADGRFESSVTEIRGGQCFNDTGYKVVMYLYGNWQGKDNTPYAYPPRSKSPDDNDCDGMFIPSNVTGGGTQGPFAAQIPNLMGFATLTMNGDRYTRQFPGGIGYLVRRKGDVNWWIENVTQENVESWGS